MKSETLECGIYLNQLAQGVARLDEGQQWFSSHSEENQKAILQRMIYMSIQAGGSTDDVPLAIPNASLNSKKTPCVLLLKEDLKVQAAKAANLRSEEYPTLFRLLLSLLSIADERRRRNKCAGGCSHWWHRDLSDPKVILKIRSEYGKGELN